MGGAALAALFGAALALAGTAFASPSLTVAGVGLLVLGCGSLAWVVLAARGVRLERAEGPSRIVEGELYPLRLRARGGLVRPPGGELRDGLLERPCAIGPRWRGLHTAAVPIAGRGVRELGAPTMVIRDPLGLCERELRGDDAGELLVLPRIEPVRATGGGGAAGARALAGLDTTAAGPDGRAAEAEVDGLRAYREGSPASRIHWPAVARTGELIERRLVAGSDAGPLVALDASRPASPADLDAAVRAGASIAHHLAASGGCAVLLPGDRRPAELEADLRGWPALHARFALVRPGGAPPAPARLMRSGALIWVTAAAEPALPAALRGHGGRRYLVAPARLLQAAADFEVAGCRGALLAGGGARAGRRARRPAARSAPR